MRGRWFVLNRNSVLRREILYIDIYIHTCMVIMSLSTIVVALDLLQKEITVFKSTITKVCYT